jgi:hypothetical protein
MANLIDDDHRDGNGFGPGVIGSIVMAMVIFGVLLLSHAG